MESKNNKPNIGDNELVVLYEKKLSLLVELFQLVKKQKPLINSNELEALFDQKDECIEALQKTDEVISIWHESYTREHDERETQLLDKIEKGMTEIWEMEQLLEQRLQKERDALNLEMEKLKNRSKYGNYLNIKKHAGQNLNFRR